MGNSDIRRYSIDELKAMRERGKVVPTAADAPMVEPDEAFWTRARVVMPAAGSGHKAKGT